MERYIVDDLLNHPFQVYKFVKMISPGDKVYSDTAETFYGYKTTIRTMVHNTKGKLVLSTIQLYIDSADFGKIDVDDLVVMTEEPSKLSVIKVQPIYHLHDKVEFEMIYLQ